MGTTRNKGNFQPIGKYSCCQQQTMRFSTVPNHSVTPNLIFDYIYSTVCFSPAARVAKQRNIQYPA